MLNYISEVNMTMISCQFDEKGLASIINILFVVVGLKVSKSADKLRSLQPESSPFTAVIVITYMRSGSSLTGDILQHSPGAFFLYEPLRRLSFLARDRFNLTFVNGSYR